MTSLEHTEFGVGYTLCFIDVDINIMHSADLLLLSPVELSLVVYYVNEDKR